MRNATLVRALSTSALLFSFIATAAACDDKKAGDCASLQSTVSADVAAVKTAAANKPAAHKEHANAARAVADAAEKLVADLAKKPLTVAEVQKASGDYSAAARAVAPAARAHGEDLDLLAAVELKTKADGAEDVKILNADLAKVKTRCKEHPAPECAKITKLTADVASMVKKPELLEKLDSDVANVVVKDAGLAPLVVALRGSIASVAKTLRDAADAVVEMKSVDAKVKSSGEALDAAIAKLDAVTTSVTKLCGAAAPASSGSAK